MASLKSSLKSSFNNLKQRTRRFVSNKRTKSILFVVIFAVIGIIALLATRAATPFASIEPEQGAVTGNACQFADSNASGGSGINFGSCGSGGAAKPPDASANGLVAKSGDKEIQLSWTAVPGASSYRVERIDVSNWVEQKDVYNLPENQQFKPLKSAISQTSFLDSQVTFSNPGGRGLVNGQIYTYRVISDNGVTRGPVKQMPDDGYELAGWTSINGVIAKKRDARNTGHWGAGKTNASLRRLEPNNCYSATACTYVMADGETLDGVFADVGVEIRGGRTNAIRNSWLRRGIANHSTNGNPASLVIEDTTLGAGPGEADPSYDYNGIIGSGVIGNYTCKRCRAMWAGSVFFASSGNVTIEDTFVHDTYGYEPPGGDAHMDVVWTQNSSGPITVRRSNLECSANCSAVLGPGPVTSGAYIVEDSLFNGGGQTIVVNSLYQLRRNRFKRAPSGFYETGALFCTFDVSYGYPGVDEDNLWIDTGQSIKGSKPNCY